MDREAKEWFQKYLDEKFDALEKRLEAACARLDKHLETPHLRYERRVSWWVTFCSGIGAVLPWGARR